MRNLGHPAAGRNAGFRAGTEAGTETQPEPEGSFGRGRDLGMTTLHRVVRRVGYDGVGYG